MLKFGKTFKERFQNWNKTTKKNTAEEGAKIMDISEESDIFENICLGRVV